MANQEKWDYKLWVIGLLTSITIVGGGYTVKTLAADVEGVKQRAIALAERQAIDDERFLEVKKWMAEMKLDIKDVRDLLVKTHMKELLADQRKGGGK